ncbi:MAG: cation:proton antiporter [Desulfuromonas sp.]|uniref:cation:proton antiporter n=1 Tax=Desulfuromonas sp. TaxID=892 RepID=UPI000CA92B7C|nr:cation:proton antiporter [Desulfuromonas sp.]PLX83332.1 MAG: cation:proton antiporter [Desulfuromonas sp.]
MSIIYILLVLLIVTRTFGEISERLGQPALLGELVSGICLGILVHHYDQQFPVLSGLTENEVFTAITDLGIFFLMLLGGIELNPVKLLKASKTSLIVATGGMVIPFALGMGFAYLALPPSDLRTAQALFLGTVMAVTAVPVSIKSLMDIGKLETKVGQTIISAAVIDDTLSLILLAVLTGFVQTGTIPDGTALALLFGKIALFFLIASALGHYLFPAIGKYLDKSKADEFEFSMLLIAALSYAMLAEFLGMHFILGAFLAGLFFRRRTITPKIYRDILAKTKGLTTGFLAPVFFASIGMHLDMKAMQVVPGFVIAMIAIATVGKVLGAGASARVAGMSPRESLAIGVGMNARGAVELIIADIALRAGIFTMPEPVHPIIQYMFSSVVIMAIATTLMTPPALKLALHKH